MKNAKLFAILVAFLAAAFYAINTPFEKLLLNDIEPTYLASFLYLGAGIGIGFLYLFRIKYESKDQRLTKKDLPYTIGMIILDILAPIFLMLGISLGNASSASLLGNFEIVATALIALLVFREKINARLWVGITCISVASALLTFSGPGYFEFSPGSLFVVLATCCWGLENNCTRRIAQKSTFQIVTLKGLCSGAGSFLIALLAGETFPTIRIILYTLLLGLVAYGFSIFLYVRAQRTLGAAKTSAYYAFSPFFGAALSFLLLGEPLSPIYFLALAIMIIGAAFAIWDSLRTIS